MEPMLAGSKEFTTMASSPGRQLSLRIFAPPLGHDQVFRLLGLLGLRQASDGSQLVVRDRPNPPPLEDAAVVIGHGVTGLRLPDHVTRWCTQSRLAGVKSNDMKDGANVAGVVGFDHDRQIAGFAVSHANSPSSFDGAVALDRL